MDLRSRKDIRDQVAFRFNVDGFANPAVASLNALIQSKTNEYWECLIQYSPTYVHSLTADVAVSVNVGNYPLTQVPRFRSLQAAYLVLDAATGRVTRLHALPEWARARVLFPQEACTVRLQYSPTAVQFTDDDTKVLEVINGTEDYIVEAVCEVLARRESRQDGGHRSAKMEAAQKLERAVKSIDETGPIYARDVEEEDVPDRFYSGSTTRYYLVRGVNIEFYSLRLFS